MKISFSVETLTLIFVILKATGVIDWPWIWVFCPIWIAIALVLLLIIIVIIVGCLGD